MKDVCVDLTITHPVQAESWPLGPETAALHLAKAEKDKREKHKDICRDMRWASHPIALTPWGGAVGARLRLSFSSSRAGSLGTFSPPTG